PPPSRPIVRPGPARSRVHVRRRDLCPGPPAGDEAGAAPEGDVRVNPVHEHQEPGAKADEKEDVDGQPGHPGWKTPELQRTADVTDRRAPSDRGEAALVEIAESTERLAAQAAQDVRGRVASLLDRGGAGPPARVFRPLL